MNQKKSGKKKPRKSSKQKKKVRSRLFLFTLLFGIITIILFSLKPYLLKRTVDFSAEEGSSEFTKEGELSFLKEGEKSIITKIDIEIADNEFERTQGLMHRHSMDQNAGMLFIMDKEEPQNFWMKETHISLDIIFLNKNLKVVKIHKYAQPFSEQSITCTKNAKYIVEVNAGFCDRFLIAEGDGVEYRRN